MRTNGSQNKNRRGSGGVISKKNLILEKNARSGGGRNKIQYQYCFEKNDSTQQMTLSKNLNL